LSRTTPTTREMNRLKYVIFFVIGLVTSKELVPLTATSKLKTTQKSELKTKESVPLAAKEHSEVHVGTGYGFVQTGTCESNGMLSIYSVAECQLAGNHAGKGKQVIWRQGNHHAGRPTGCSWHHFGNLELWDISHGDCDVNGYSGCFCKKKYDFVTDGTCESHGMASIHDVTECQEAGDDAGTNKKVMFKEGHHSNGRPNGCSWHSFGNLELWEVASGACNVNGYGGCFCKQKYTLVSGGTCEAHGMISIHTVEQCQAAGDSAGKNRNVQFKAGDFRDGRPTGCSWHNFGNLELWEESSGRCDVNGYAGCFCRIKYYEFIRDLTCELEGMTSIHNATECQLAGRHFGHPETLIFRGNEHWGTGRPTGCSWHHWGNLELWEFATGDCDINGYGGCFCYA
jgi:hypothetical protein